MRFSYLTALVYCARGTSVNAKLSVRLKGAFKNGEAAHTNRLCEILDESGFKQKFEDSILVPMPRSAPFVAGALYPAKVIADTMVQNGFGDRVSLCLRRKYAIPRSSSAYTKETRPSLRTIYESLEVIAEIIPQETIIIVDDILTIGRNSMAAAARLQEAYPEKRIKIFSVFRTRGSDNNILIDIKTGIMELNASKTDVILPD